MWFVISGKVKHLKTSGFEYPPPPPPHSFLLCGNKLSGTTLPCVFFSLRICIRDYNNAVTSCLVCLIQTMFVVNVLSYWQKQ